jgi:hypothetical protein
VTAEKVISTGVPTELVRGDVFFWQSLQAATVLVAFPIAFVFNLFWTGSSEASPWAPSRVDHGTFASADQRLGSPEWRM